MSFEKIGLLHSRSRPQWRVLTGSSGGDVLVDVFWHKPAELAHPFLFFSWCLSFCLYGPFNCILFHKFSWQLSTFWLCSFGLIFAILLVSTTSVFESLHWLPVKERIFFKIATFAFHFFDGTLPPYLSSCLSVYIPSHTLHSSSNEKTFSCAK